MSTLLWWGYLHIDGEVKVKRFFDQRDIEDAYDSPFVDEVIQPFHATGRADAVHKAEKILTGK